MARADDSSAMAWQDLVKNYRREGGESFHALAGITASVRHGAVTALVGPDGAGKTTLIRIACGLVGVDAGKMLVLGLDVSAHAQEVQSRIGYMPQRFGLYEDLSVQENLNLYADLHGVTPAQRQERYPRLMEMTALAPFTGRRAGRLSGGMKQKLGLACTLVRSPELLLLDEPTAGVDPLSRRELWAIIDQLVQEQQLTVLISTSYLDEADRCAHVVVLHEGKVLAQGPPEATSRLAAGRTFRVDPKTRLRPRELQARLMSDTAVIDAVPEGGHVRLVADAAAMAENGHLQDLELRPVTPRFEDGFMVLLRGAVADEHAGRVSHQPLPPSPAGVDHEVVVEVKDLVRRFGDFYAVNHISFQIHRGEIFGLLGPNGAGKSTTFRMLCGLLPASGGALKVAGVDLRHARASARQRIGYVAQKFSLYGQLSVRENLEFFAGAYGLRGGRRRERIAWAVQEFELGSFFTLAAGMLPGGYKQRLAMACALLHEPGILFLDEPTSGVDPLARREFWHRITALSEQGVTVVVTTHFMEEAEYCDRMVILVAGRILAEGSPAEIRHRAKVPPEREPSIEDAFISIVEQSRREEAGGQEAGGV